MPVYEHAPHAIAQSPIHTVGIAYGHNGNERIASEYRTTIVAHRLTRFCLANHRHIGLQCGHIAEPTVVYGRYSVEPNAQPHHLHLMAEKRSMPAELSMWRMNP